MIKQVLSLDHKAYSAEIPYVNSVKKKIADSVETQKRPFHER